MRQTPDRSIADDTRGKAVTIGGEVAFSKTGPSTRGSDIAAAKIPELTEPSGIDRNVSKITVHSTARFQS